MKTKRIQMSQATMLGIVFTLLLVLARMELRAETHLAEASSQKQASAAVQQITRPLSFEPVTGKGRQKASFAARGPGSRFIVDASGVEMLLSQSKSANPGAGPKQAIASEKDQQVIRLKLRGASPDAVATAQEELPGKANYFVGNDRKQWRMGVPTYAKVKCANVYPGIDLVYYGNNRQLEFDFVVGPGADPGRIRMAFAGADKLEIAKNGDLILHSRGGEFRQHKPLVYQTVNGTRHEIPGCYRLNKDQVRFELAAYDRALPVVIDPTLEYSTYLGGSYMDLANDIAVDQEGNFYVVGTTYSSDFPAINALLRPADSLGFPGAFQVFITKFNKNGAVCYSTYLGMLTAGACWGNSIAVDAAENVYVSGWAWANGPGSFPTTPGAFQTAGHGVTDGFVTKLRSDGAALVYSTLLGGSGIDAATSVAIDSSGAAYVCGTTESADFPVTPGAFQPSLTGVPGVRDAFVAKLDPSGSSLDYCTYLGGSNDEQVGGIAVNGSGNAYVAGFTSSSDFPASSGAYQNHLAGSRNAFVTEFNSDGSALIFSTYLGGSHQEYMGGAGYSGRAIALGSDGSVYVTGTSCSPDFPTANALQAVLGNCNGFVTKLRPDGSDLAWSTFLGCGTVVLPYAIAVDNSGDATVVGTAGGGFPTLNAIQASLEGNLYNPFAAKISSDGSRLLYSTYLGGGTDDYPINIATCAAVDSGGKAYVAGYTRSPIFPIKGEAYQSSLADAAYQPGDGGNRGGDAFVAIIHSEDEPPPPLAIVAPADYTVPNEPGRCTGYVRYDVRLEGTTFCAELVTDPPNHTDLHLPIGTTIVRCSAHDVFGNSNYYSFNVTVVDTESPTITCPANLVVNTDPGQCSAVVNYTVTATHLCGSGANLVCVPPSGSAFPKGTTVVNCLATSSSGKQANCAFTVTVRDTEKPTIDCPTDIAVGCSPDLLVPVSFSVTATDNCDPNLTLTISKVSGSGFLVGTTPVTCTAKDSSGNQASRSFNVIRAPLAFDGFLSPLGGADAAGGTFDAPLRTFKLDSTIPVKFKIACGGAPVVSGAHRLQVIRYSDQTTAGNPIDATPQDAATEGDQFRLADGQWLFNLDTRGTGMSSGIWLLRATLSDDSQHSAWIQIK